MKKNFLFAFGLLSLIACNSKTSEQKAPENEKKDSNKTEKIVSKEQNITTSPQSTWEGFFEFNENPGETAGGTPITYSYSLEFRPDGSVHYNIDGYQTMVRAICSLKEIDEKTAELFFVTFGEEDLFKTQFQKGQLVAKIIRIDEKNIKFLENGKTEKGIFKRIN